MVNRWCAARRQTGTKDSVARLSSGRQAENTQSSLGKRETWASIACLPETRQEDFYGQVCYDQVFKLQDESEGATDLRSDEDGIQSEFFLLNGIDVRDGERVDDKGAELQLKARRCSIQCKSLSKRGKGGREI